MIRLTSTSFLLPSLHSWNYLKSRFEINFGEYGDWHSVLFGEGVEKIVWVVFLQDIFSEDASNKTKEEIDIQLQKLLNPLTNYLNKTNEPFILVWSSHKAESIIREAKNQTSWRKFSQRFEEVLYQLSADKSNLYLINLDSVFAVDGLANAFSPRNYYASRCWLSVTGILLLADSIGTLLTRISNVPKKVLVLDCDNTLWGGVIGEVGLKGIALGTDGIGKAYSDFQREITRLAKNGLLLAISSKNDEQDVWDVFDLSSEMIIKREMILSAKINWEEKSENIRSIADELSLGLNSIVFWDDNPIEREKMRLLLPEVLTVDIPSEVYKWPNLIAGLDVFANFFTTEEDLKKSDQYHKRAAFVSEKKSNNNIKQFLTSIKMQPTLCPLDESSLGRAEQLCGKTNQFNLRTIRHSKNALEIFSKNKQAFIVQLVDQYGDHGKISLIITDNINSQVAFLNTFLMSCRVLGRYLEGWILNQIILQLKKKDIKYLLAEFIPSGKNNVAENFLIENGFLICEENSEIASVFKQYQLGYPEVSGKGILYFADIHTIQIPNLEVFIN